MSERHKHDSIRTGFDGSLADVDGERELLSNGSKDRRVRSGGFSGHPDEFHDFVR